MKLKSQYDPASFKPASHHWSVIDDDTYDGAEDSHPRCRIVGHGASENAALLDWYEQYKALRD